MSNPEAIAADRAPLTDEELTEAQLFVDAWWLPGVEINETRMAALLGRAVAEIRRARAERLTDAEVEAITFMRRCINIRTMRRRIHGPTMTHDDLRVVTLGPRGKSIDKVNHAFLALDRLIAERGAR